MHVNCFIARTTKYIECYGRNNPNTGHSACDKRKVQKNKSSYDKKYRGSNGSNKNVIVDRSAQMQNQI